MGFSISDNQNTPFFINSHEIKEDYLIIYVDITVNVIFAINLDSQAKFPIQLEYQEVLTLINEGAIFLFEMDWSAFEPTILMDTESLTEWRKNRVNERLSVIKPLLENLDSVLRNDYGQNCFELAGRTSGRSKQYVYDCFYGYLRMGQRAAGLSFPIGKNVNIVPKKRIQHVKLGRPNQAIPEGKVLEEIDYKNFNEAKRLFIKDRLSINKCYQKMLTKKYFSSRVKLNFMEARKTGERFKVNLKPLYEMPTYNQFRYWLNKEFDGNIPRRNKEKQNSIENKKDNAGRTGNAYQHIIGPGQVFELDETPMTEELVSVFDPTRSTKIGKGTVYFVIDVFSKLIIGLFITTENPSYNTVKQAIFNAARDKQKWVDELGFNFNMSYWSQRGIPSCIFVDKAEFHNKVSEGPISDLPVTIKFSRTGRGDDKPNVEQLFHIFQGYFEGQSKGNQTKSKIEIAKQIARKHACLTIPELYQIAIVYALYHNNNRLLKNYPIEREMVRDGVPAIPAKLWEWGMMYRPGYLINLSDNDLYFKLLAKGVLTVHKKGLYLREKGLWYNCDWVLNSGLQERKLPNQRHLTVFCRYNAELVDIIFIETTDGLKPAFLDHKDNRFQGLSFNQVAKQKDTEFSEKQLTIAEELQYLLGVDHFIEKTLKSANKEKLPGSIPTLSKIKDNRKVESLINREMDLHRYIQGIHESALINFNNLSNNENNHSEHKGYSAFDGDDE